MTTTAAVRTLETLPRRRGLLRRMMSQPRFVLGVILLVFVLLVAFAGSYLAPYAQDAYVGSPNRLAADGTLLGTDAMGQDVFSRVLRGGVTVVWMSAAAAGLGVVLGGLIGMTAGYTRGWVDETLMRIVDVWLVIPTIVFVMLVVSVYGRELWLLVLLVGLAHTPQVARVIRGVTVEVGSREFVESAQTLGSRTLRTIATQILPNITSTVAVEFGLRLVWSIGILASLSVLGLGVPAPIADWGAMIGENRGALATQPWGVFAPLLMIVVYALGANLVTDGAARSLNVTTLEERA